MDGIDLLLLDCGCACWQYTRVMVDLFGGCAVAGIGDFMGILPYVVEKTKGYVRDECENGGYGNGNLSVKGIVYG